MARVVVERKNAGKREVDAPNGRRMIETALGRPEIAGLGRQDGGALYMRAQTKNFVAFGFVCRPKTADKGAPDTRCSSPISSRWGMVRREAQRRNFDGGEQGKTGNLEENVNQDREGEYVSDFAALARAILDPGLTCHNAQKKKKRRTFARGSTRAPGRFH